MINDDKLGRFHGLLPYMIWAAVLHVTATTTPAMRRLGLVGDAVALWSRASRQRRAWARHEARCHAFVEAAAAAGGRTVVVLGSGLVRDIPLASLAARFERVVLVDAVHLLPARRSARAVGAVIVAADLSGRHPETLADLASDRSVDLVISANLLSQMPLAYRRRDDDWDSPEITRRIGERHLADLAAFEAPVCLISDVAYRDRHTDGTSTAENPLVDETLLPAAAETWDWEVAPRGEIGRGFARIHRVCAWRLAPGDIGPRRG